MKPHEEKWNISGAVLDFPDGRWGRMNADECRITDELDDARARLAAQAPAMARLLMKQLAYGVMQGGCVACPGCGKHPEDGHPDTCELMIVLRDTGVIP